MKSNESRKQKILVTGFEAFGGRSLNPSQLLLPEIARSCDFVDTIVLPVHFENSFLTFMKHWQIHESSYQAVVLMGQAAGRRGISLERVALNWMRSDKQDVDGNIVSTGRILEGAPEAFIVDFFPDEWKDILSELGETHVSLSAGAYVCNNLYYRVIHQLSEQNVPVLFVHLPLLPEQISDADQHSPTMSLADQSKVLVKLLDLIRNLSN